MYKAIWQTRLSSDIELPSNIREISGEMHDKIALLLKRDYTSNISGYTITNSGIRGIEYRIGRGSLIYGQGAQLQIELQHQTPQALEVLCNRVEKEASAIDFEKEDAYTERPNQKSQLKPSIAA